MPEVAFRSAWDDPNVKAALKSKRPPSDIALICCSMCGNYGYYNQGSHFSCSCEGCDWSISGDEIDAWIDNGEVTTLDDLNYGEECGP